jgi:hypothetical protein
MPDTTKKEYLGDGVYVAFDDYSIILTTENGIIVTNTIYLDHYVIRALRKYIDKIEKK